MTSNTILTLIKIQKKAGPHHSDSNSFAKVVAKRASEM